MTSYNIIMYLSIGGINTVTRNITVDQGDQIRFHIGKESSAELKEGHERGKWRNEKIWRKDNQNTNTE